MTYPTCTARKMSWRPKWGYLHGIGRRCFSLTDFHSLTPWTSTSFPSSFKLVQNHNKNKESKTVILIQREKQIWVAQYLVVWAEDQPPNRLAQTVFFFWFWCRLEFSPSWRGGLPVGVRYVYIIYIHIDLYIYTRIYQSRRDVFAWRVAVLEARYGH